MYGFLPEIGCLTSPGGKGDVLIFTSPGNIWWKKIYESVIILYEVHVISAGRFSLLIFLGTRSCHVWELMQDVRLFFYFFLYFRFHERLNCIKGWGWVVIRRQNLPHKLFYYSKSLLKYLLGCIVEVSSFQGINFDKFTYGQHKLLASTQNRTFLNKRRLKVKH